MQITKDIPVPAKDREPHHIGEESFKKFQAGKMTDDEVFSFMEHISSCTYCAEQFSSFEEKEQDLLKIPLDFKRDVMTEASRISRTTKSAKQAFRRYCLQVAFSMGAALVLIFSGSNLKLSELPKKTLPKTDFSITAFLNEQVNHITDSISISWEELLHDKKEK